MKIGKPFNQLTKQEYVYFIENNKSYSDFNTLGLYRSLSENNTLDLKEKIEIRGLANKYFQKTFDFLQLKDPLTYYNVMAIGEDFTEGDKHGLWDRIRENQQKILKDKKIRHRNFGTYSLHSCPYDDCPYNGLMIRQGSVLVHSSMRLPGDKNRYQKRVKSERLAKQQRDFKQGNRE